MYWAPKPRMPLLNPIFPNLRVGMAEPWARPARDAAAINLENERRDKDFMPTMIMYFRV
jgi:hypothetical protein